MSADHPPGRRSFNVEGLTAPSGYSHVTIAAPGDIVFVSGQVATTDPSAPANIRAQAHAVFANLLRALEAASCTFRDVVKMTTYLVEAADIPVLQAVRAEVFAQSFPSPSGYPASTLVVVSALARPEILVEIDVVAVRARQAG